MSSAYSAFGVTKLMRRFAWDQGMTTLTVSDEIGSAVQQNLTWAMHTRAHITLDGARAQLSQGGVQMVARLVAPEGAVFSEAEVELRAPQKSAAGIRKLMVELASVEAAGSSVVVSFSLLGQ